MNEFKLTCAFDAFKARIKERIDVFESLRQLQMTNIEELQTARQQRRTAYYETVKVLNECFQEANTELVNDFANTQVGGYQIAGVTKSTDTEIKEFRESCRSYISALKGVEVNASLSDIMVSPDIVNYEERARMTIEEKERFILQKLCDVNTGAYFDVRWILESNAVKSRNYNETRELANSLAEMGYIDIIGTISGIAASITTEGIRFLEQSAKENRNTGSSIPADYQEICSKIDQVVEMLVKAGVEREILFEEMEELKELYKFLNKKTWRQTLMGKLGDIAIAKAAEADTINAAYQFLTGDSHKLIG